MIRVSRGLVPMIGIAAIMVLLSPTNASAGTPLPGSDTEQRVVVERVLVPVPVPVDDKTSELVQMEIAAVVGAAIAGTATAARLRHRHRHRQGAVAGDIAGGMVVLSAPNATPREEPWVSALSAHRH